jgi:GxxExxY protein
VEEKVIVELKASERISAAHESQLLNYLRASGLRVGLILNFGPKATYRRMLWSGGRPEIGETGG